MLTFHRIFSNFSLFFVDSTSMLTMSFSLSLFRSSSFRHSWVFSLGCRQNRQHAFKFYVYFIHRSVVVGLYVSGAWALKTTIHFRRCFSFAHSSIFIRTMFYFHFFFSATMRFSMVSKKIVKKRARIHAHNGTKWWRGKCYWWWCVACTRTKEATTTAFKNSHRLSSEWRRRPRLKMMKKENTFRISFLGGQMWKE